MTVTWRPLAVGGLIGACLVACCPWEKGRLEAKYDELEKRTRQTGPPANPQERVVERRTVVVRDSPTSDSEARREESEASDEEAKDQPPLSPEEHVRVVLEERFVGEQVEADASTRVALLRDALADGLRGTNSSLESVECRDTLCRVEFEFESGGVRDSVIRETFMGPTATLHNKVGGVLILHSPQGEAGRDGTVLFVARPGEDISVNPPSSLPPGVPGEGD